MGFSEGSADEFLLTCFVCKGSFGMVALFCGECGCKREQALGIERATTQQRIINNDLISPSYQTQKSSMPTAPSSNAPFGTPFPTPMAVPLKPARKKSIPFQIFRQNIRLRLERVNNLQQRHAVKLNFTGSILFLTGLYVVVQSSIFANSSPILNVEDVLKTGIVRDETYFTLTNTEDKKKNFPPAFQIWKESGAREWATSYSVNGWKGRGIVQSFPVGSSFEDTAVELQVKAIYVSKYRIFREIKWVPANPAAQIKINYPSNRQTLIYINGLIAGTVGNPAVQEGTYSLYPGPLEMTFYLNGEETTDSFSYFIESYGRYEN